MVDDIIKYDLPAISQRLFDIKDNFDIDSISFMMLTHAHDLVCAVCELNSVRDE